jgi:hypothetical protein
MKPRRKMAAIMLFAAMLVGTERGATSAQDRPPDLRMLMNMDLFEPRPGNGEHGAPASAAPAAAASPSDDSMLDQIRTLNAMGYLGNHAEAGANAADSAAERSDVPAARAVVAAPTADEPAPRPDPASQPSYDAEGPQP